MVFGVNYITLPTIPGFSGFDINFGSIFQGVIGFVALMFVFVLIGGMLFYFLHQRKNKKLYSKNIHWFEEVNGRFVPLDDDVAAELTIPHTNIQVFYIKKKDLYLPRLTRRMGKNAYWVGIKNNKEVINFTLKNLNEDMTEANLDYDHTDMRYALTNLLDLIKRNYKDKSQPWWREYKEVISLVILIFALSVSFFVLLWRTGQLIDQVGLLIDHADRVVQTAYAKSGSGVIQA